jgi:hypothetical protein
MNQYWKNIVVAIGCGLISIAATLASFSGHLIVGTLAAGIPIGLAMAAITGDWRPFGRRNHG